MRFKSNYMHHKIYSITILAICWIAILCHPLQSKVTSIDNQYADWNNSMTYLYKHPGYSSYEPVADIKKYGCNWGTWVTFPQKIEAIQAQVGKIRTTLDLLRSKDFLAMYKHPTYYVEAFLDYIADDRYTLSQKKIAIYATVHCPSICWKRVYELYEKKKIDLDTLALVLRIGITNNWYPLCFSPEVKGYRPYGSYILWLQNLVQNLPNDSDFSKELAGIFSKGELPNAWREYAIHLHRSCEGHIVIDHPSHNYYVQRFPFYATLSDAVTDIHYLPGYSFNDSNKLLDFDRDPYFLMAMEHPADYYPVDLAKLKSTPFNPNGTQEPSLKEYANGINLLCDKCYTDEEKSMAIFAMSQLGLTSSDRKFLLCFFSRECYSLV